VIEQVIAALLAGGHVMIEGVPGLAKTLLAQCLATAIGGKFARIQFTPDLMPADVTGHAMYDMQIGEIPPAARAGVLQRFTGRRDQPGPAKTQAALLEVMQEQRVTIEGKPLAVPEPFMVLATQNPIEHEGTYVLPEAQLDRFIMKVLIDYPDAEHEQQIAMNMAGMRDDLVTLAPRWIPYLNRTLRCNCASRLAPYRSTRPLPNTRLRSQEPPANGRASTSAPDHAPALPCCASPRPAPCSRVAISSSPTMSSASPWPVFAIASCSVLNCRWKARQQTKCSSA
jgi:hypothetical protein